MLYLAQRMLDSNIHANLYLAWFMLGAKRAFGGNLGGAAKCPQNPRLAYFMLT